MTIATVRLLYGDTAEPYLLTDEQVTVAIDATTSDLSAAAMCARALAARYARDVDTKFETVSASYGQRSKAFAMLARALEQQAMRAGGLGLPLAGGISKADVEAALADADRVESYFYADMFSNPPGPNTPVDED